jgi:hypothetical protein
VQVYYSRDLPVGTLDLQHDLEHGTGQYKYNRTEEFKLKGKTLLSTTFEVFTTMKIQVVVFWIVTP